ncbi:GNAT family N-acetyltransferase [Colwelliaceae bacterium 6441]
MESSVRKANKRYADTSLSLQAYPPLSESLLQQKRLDKSKTNFLPVFPKENESVKSHHLTIRLLTIDDKALFIKLFTDEQVTLYTGGKQAINKAAENFNQSLLALNKKPNTHITWVAQTPHHKIGIATLTMLPHLPCYAEIGVMFTTENQRKGFGCQLFTQLLATAFNLYQLKAVVCFTENDNVQVEHILRKYGFEPFKNNRLNPPSSSGGYWRLTADVTR